MELLQLKALNNVLGLKTTSNFDLLKSLMIKSRQ